MGMEVPKKKEATRSPHVIRRQYLFNQIITVIMTLAFSLMLEVSNVR